LDDGFVVHAPVDALRPNPFGLHHVHGNVWEWCLDSWSGYLGEAVQDPVIDVPGARTRVYRGGSFDHSASNARCGSRFFSAPGARNYNLGLRPAKGITP
jgi:formylglycine-generating enzyme required for sulfatase activity